MLKYYSFFSYSFSKDGFYVIIATYNAKIFFEVMLSRINSKFVEKQKI